MDISEKLTLLRVKQGLSYGRLGQLAHISPSTYLQWEHGVVPTRLKLAPVLELFSDLYETEIIEREMRDDSLSLRFEKTGKPFFAPDKTLDAPQQFSATPSDRARAETLLEYEGLYSRLRVSGDLTEKELQMLLYLLKGFARDKNGRRSPKQTVHGEVQDDD